MQKGFIAIGKAATYFGVYLLTQALVSVVYSTVLTAQITAEIMATGEELDIVTMTEMVTESIMGRLMEMTFVAGLVALTIFWLVFLIRKKKFTREVALHKIPFSGILPISIMAVCFNIITTVLVSIVPWPQHWMDAYIENSSAIDGSMMAWFAAVLMAPVLEEIVFRGLVYTRLKKGLPMIVAVMLTCAAFGVAHGTVIWAIYTFIFSLVLIWVMERFQSLLASIILHMAYNLSGMALSLIPEEAGMVVLVLFVLSVIGACFMYKVIIKITADIPRIEDVVFSIAETPFIDSVENSTTEDSNEVEEE